MKGVWFYQLEMLCSIQAVQVELSYAEYLPPWCCEIQRGNKCRNVFYIQNVI